MLHELDKFFERHKLSKLAQEEIKNLKHTVYLIDSVNINFSAKNSLGQITSLANFTMHLGKNYYQIYKRQIL